jgi:hypothetical protein
MTNMGRLIAALHRVTFTHPLPAPKPPVTFRIKK